MDKLRISYVPREDATPEGEIAALATAYGFLLECHEKKKAARVGNGERRSGHDGAEELVTEQREL